MAKAKSRRGHLGRGAKTVLCLAALVSVGAPGALKACTQIHRHGKSHASAPPLHFEVSKTASGASLGYSARAASYTLFLSNDEADVVLHREKAPSGEVSRGKLIVVRAYAALLRMRFVDSNPPTSIAPVGGEKRAGSYPAAVAYRGIYPGTDVIVGGDRQRIGFQLNLSPGSDSDHVVLEIAGASSIELDREGNAVVHAGSESLVLQRPSVRPGAGANSRTPGAYRIESGNRLRFIVDASTSENNPSVID